MPSLENVEVYPACDIRLGELCRDETGAIDTIISVNPDAAKQVLLETAKTARVKHLPNVLLIAAHPETVDPAANQPGSGMWVGGEMRHRAGEDPTVLVNVLGEPSQKLSPDLIDMVIDRAKENIDTNQLSRGGERRIRKQLGKNLRYPHEMDRTVFHEFQHVADFSSKRVLRKQDRYKRRYERMVDASVYVATLGYLAAMHGMTTVIPGEEIPIATQLQIGGGTVLGTACAAAQAYRWYRKRNHNHHKEYLGKPIEKRARKAEEKSTDYSNRQSWVIDYAFIDTTKTLKAQR